MKFLVRMVLYFLLLYVALILFKASKTTGLHWQFDGLEHVLVIH